MNRSARAEMPGSSAKNLLSVEVTACCVVVGGFLNVEQKMMLLLVQVSDKKSRGRKE
jgi:hypothetical protein